MRKSQTPLADDDPFAHLTAAERFALAVERRDALTRGRRTSELRSREISPSRIDSRDDRER